MTTKFFAYKGYVGATTDIENGKFLNDLTQAGQLGIVVDTTEIEMSKEAKEIIKKAPREGGSFAQLMLTKHDAGGSSIGMVEISPIHFLGNDFKIGRTCTTSILNDCTEVENDVPKGFMEVVDEIIIL